VNALNGKQAVGLFSERYGAPPRGDLSALRALARSFSNLPYENLSKILVSSETRLRLPLEVMGDHLELGTGGTCFSLTELLRVLVTHCGLRCYPVMAHMRHGANIHCALRVEAGGRAYLVDPGYLLPRPLELEERTPEEPPEAGHPVIVAAGSLPGAPPGIPPGDFDLFTAEQHGYKWRYRFSDSSPTEEEFFARWRQSFDLPGMRSLVATRRDDAGARVYLHNHKLRVQGADHKRTRNVRASLEASVEQTFGIDPRVTSEARAILDRRKERWRRGS